MNEISNYKIIFHNYEIINEDSDKYIVIYPDKDKFNDFGFDGKVNIKISSNKENKVVKLLGFIGYIKIENIDNNKMVSNEYSEEKNGKKMLLSLLNKNTSNHVDMKTYMDKNGIEFFTMLRELKQYRTLVKTFGSIDALNILNSINDVSMSSTDKKISESEYEFKKHDIFNKSFLRQAESYFAYKKSYIVLNGLDKETTGLLSGNITIFSKDDNVPNLSFDFEHENDLPKRVSIIIGENGVGKSQTLRKIALAAINGTSDILDINNKDKTKKRVEINRLLVFSFVNEENPTFPSDNQQDSKIWYKRFILNNHCDIDRYVNVNDVIIDLIRNEDNILNRRRFDIFMSAISNVSNFLELALTKINHEKPEYLKNINSSGEEHRLDMWKQIDKTKEPVKYINNEIHHLSSGEMSFVKFCAQICSNIENGSLILLDEPETHLHPAFINKFFSLLDSLLKQTGSSAIIATHSVYFVREVFKEQVTVLRRLESGIIEYEKPRLSTFGANIGNISYFVFGESEPTHILREVINEIIKSNFSWQDVYDKYKDDLSINVLTKIRDEIGGNYFE